MSTEFDVLVVGSCNFDLVAYTKVFPKIGETVRGYKFDVGTGGKGFNQCIAAAKLGAKTAMIAKIGNDQFGEKFLKAFVDHRVDTSYLKIIDESTGVAQITVNDKGENVITVVQGANNKLTAEDVENLMNATMSVKVALFQFEIPLEVTKTALKICSNRNNCITIVNGAPGLAQVPSEILQTCDIFCVNETEAEIISGIPVKNIQDAKQAALILRNKGCKLPLITLGGEGVVYISNTCESPEHISVNKVQAIDTTGAGDAFLGGLAYFICKFPNLTLADNLKRACEVAKYSVMRPGSSVSFPFKKDLSEDLFS